MSKSSAAISLVLLGTVSAAFVGYKAATGRADRLELGPATVRGREGAAYPSGVQALPVGVDDPRDPLDGPHVVKPMLGREGNTSRFVPHVFSVY